MKKNRTAEILKYFVPPLITVAVILIIYAVKGQYPFGDGTMIDNDWGPGDFAGFVRFWDVAHGKSSLFFDWSTGLGLPKSPLSLFFYPVNDLLLLFKRDFLFEAMNYYYVAQMATISVTSFAFFRNVFKKLPLYYAYLFSLAFTFCGFNLQYYTNISWLSAVAVFPLVALAAYKLIAEKRFVFYTFILAYSLLVNTYFSFFMLEGIVLIGTLYIFCFLNKDDRKGAAFRLGMGTALAFLMTYWSSFGFVLSTAGSTRVQSDVGNGILAEFINILKAENIVNSYKILMLLGMEIGIVSLAMIAIKQKSEIKKTIFFVTGFVLFVLPIIFESIDLILNGGSYNYYVMRNGFLISFFLCCAAAYYFSFSDSTDEREKNRFLVYLKPILAVLAFYITVPIYMVMTQPLAANSALSNNGKMLGLSVLSKMVWIWISVIATIVIILLIKKKSVRTVFLCLLLIFVIGIDSYRLIGARENDYDPIKGDRTETYIKDSFALREELKNNDTFERINNPTGELYMNYPMLINRTAVSDWSHIVSGGLRQIFYQFGYGMMYTCLSDEGSTAFGSAILGIKDQISTLQLNENLYLQEKKLGNGYFLYKNVYTLPFGIPFDEAVFNIEFNGNFFDYQNEIYRKMMGEDGDLFSEKKPQDKRFETYTEEVPSRYDRSYTVERDKYKAVFTYHVEEESILYFYLDDGSDIINDSIVVNDCTIRVNEKPLSIPNFESIESDTYRRGNNNSILELGTFENEDVTIELNSTHPEIDKPVVYAMSLEKLGELCDGYESCVTEYSTGKKSIAIKATGESGKYLFIPVYNNGGWVCTVNGEKTEVRSVLGSLTAIPLKDGENDIFIEYVPQRFYITFTFSVAVFVLFVLAVLFIKRRKNQAPEKLQTLFLWALTGLFSAFIAIAYIAPLIAQVYYAFAGRE